MDSIKPSERCPSKSSVAFLCAIKRSLKYANISKPHHPFLKRKRFKETVDNISQKLAQSVKIGSAEYALELVKTINDRDYSLQFCAEIIALSMERGDSDKAIEMSGEMLSEFQERANSAGLPS